MADTPEQSQRDDPSHTIHPSAQAILGALALALALVLLQLAGASDFVTDILSITILTGTLAFARVLDRRMGVAGAVIAGAAAAIVPGGTPAFPPHSPWEVLPRLAAFATMATMYYLVVVALRTREERLQRQFADLRILHEEVRALHVLAAGSPIDREAVYQHIVEAGARLTQGPRSRLALLTEHEATRSVVAAWPPSVGDRNMYTVVTQTLAPVPDAVPMESGDDRMSVALTGEAGTIGYIEIEQRRHAGKDQDRADLVAVYARDAGLALEHITLRERLERLQLAEERARIARELHDGLVQTLGAVAYRMEYYADTLSPDTIEPVRQGLEMAGTNVRGALRQARLMIHGLRDPRTTDDVCDRLRAMLDVMASETGIAVSLDLPDTPPALPASYADTICAVAQEALLNARKHADAEAVALALLVAQDRIELTITDDGRGFEEDSQGMDPPRLRYGLLGMRERAAQQGGAVTIQTAPGMGTCVTLSLPIKEAA
jgi:signal transduction histidine kinase